MLIGDLVPFFLFICLQCQILKWVAFPIEHQSSGRGYVRRFKCWKGGGTSEKHRRIEIQETPKTQAKNHCPTLVPWPNSLIKLTIFYKNVYQKPHLTGCSLPDTFSIASFQPSPYNPKRIIIDLSRIWHQKFIQSASLTTPKQRATPGQV